MFFVATHMNPGKVLFPKTLSGKIFEINFFFKCTNLNRKINEIFLVKNNENGNLKSNIFEPKLSKEKHILYICKIIFLS